MSAPEPPDLTGIEHALGPAGATAGHLMALTGRSEVAVRSAIDHLDTAIVPAGGSTQAAPLVAGYVAGLLMDDLVRGADTRIELLYFLGQITEAAEGASDEPGVAGCRALLPRILAVAEQCESDRNTDVRVEAADCAEAAIDVMDRLGID
jgi:hypothetical protein